MLSYIAIYYIFKNACILLLKDKIAFVVFLLLANVNWNTLSGKSKVIFLLKSWKITKTDGWELCFFIRDGLQQFFLEKICERNKLSNVEFLGSVLHSEIYELVAEGKVFCLASFNEVFPAVVTESMNMGNAIITTKFDGLSGGLLNVKNCIVAKARVRTYLQALNKVLLNDSLVTRMGKSAYERGKEFYSSEEYLEAR